MYVANLPILYLWQILVSRAGKKDERSKGKAVDGHVEVYQVEVAPSGDPFSCGGVSYSR